DIGIGTQVAVEFDHEGLTEAHDLGVGLALGVEVGSAFAAAHGQGGEGVLEGLLESQELEDGKVDRGVEAHAALEGAYGRAVLYAETAIHLYFALVIDPGNTELDGALGFDQALQQALIGVLGVTLDERPQTIHYLFDGLHELGLVRVPGDRKST